MPLCFDSKGHITDHGFQLLIHGSPDELQRYELAEHLDYCDHCIDRYTELLSDVRLLSPPESIAPTIMEKIRHRIRLILLSRIVQVSVAACLTLVIWLGGIPKWNFLPTDPDEFTDHGISAFQQTMQGANEGLDHLFANFNAFLRGDHPDTTQ